jgi:hypothetical protein
MISTNYSDTTPDIAISYDCLGRKTSESSLLSSVSQSSVSYAYNSNLQLDTETITYNLPNQSAFTRVIDRSQDNLSRESGWQLKNNTTPENDVQYLYSTTDGRLATVRRGDIPVPQEFNYTYTAQSNLIASITSPAHTVSNVYEPTRNVLDSKVNKKLDTTTVSSYFYTVNQYGQRTGVTTGGTAFSGTPSWLWGYNNKGEVVKADHSTDLNLNRLQGSAGVSPASVTNYTPNALNQYSSITNPQSTIHNPQSHPRL